MILLTIWLKNHPLPSGAALGLGDLVSASTSDPFERRRLRRQFEQIGDRIAEQLTPLIESEFSGLPANEIRAIVLLTEEVLREAELDASVFAALDAEPRKVETRAREHASERIEQAHLTAAGDAFFDLLLMETMSYLVELAIDLPPFQTSAAQEMLRRESLILDLVNEVFERLPQAPQFLGGHPGGAAAAFETEYRRALTRQLDEIELFGLDLPEYRRRYDLSVAYISLVLDRKSGLEDEEAGLDQTCEVDGDEGRTMGTPGGEASRYSGSGHVLNEMPRAIITGQAGSGKTTLLQWLAVNACRGDLESQLSSLGDTVPFFIALRRFADISLPAPEEFMLRELAGVMPQGWIHDQLGAGRGLVLVDGLDEMPPERRDEVRRWLRELVDLFPESRFVVTSRPPALEEGWLDERDFALAELQPMSITDISLFIEHWHRAAIEDPHDEAEKEKLQALSEALLRQIREDRSVRALATSPLLCAMLCALHRDRKSYMPRGRLEIYRAALEGLVDRRDVEREVATGLPAQSLSLPEKLVLLRDLSHWLLVNSYTDAPIDRCTERVAQKLKSMPHLNYSAEQVFEYLLTRSGVLREPVPGQVDFLHRTFQEYLAAQEIVEQDNIGHLVREAVNDEWREVTILASGHARRDQREQLIAGLIERGRDEPDNAYRLHLLAVACLDTSVELAEERTEELKAILAELIPPHTMTDAIALASAGELAVPLLGSNWRRTKARTTAACVRSLALIGGEQSLTHLEQIAPDRRLTVGRELIRMWDEFDLEEYARRVLSKSPIFADRSLMMPPEKALYAAHLTGLQGLQIGGFRVTGEVPGGRLSFEPLVPSPDLRHLVLADLEAEIDFKAITGLTGLTDLTVMSCPLVSNIDTLGDCEKLTTLALSFVDVDDLGFVGRIEGLQRLRLLTLHVTDLGDLAELEQLRALEVHQLPAVTDLSELAELKLDRLRLTGMEAAADLGWLAAQPQLSSLMVESHDGDLSEFFAHPSLEELEVTVPGVLEIGSSIVSGSLKILSFYRPGDLEDIAAVAHCPNLVSLDLEGAFDLEDIGPLASCRNLERLSLVGSSVEDLSPLAGLNSLRRLDLRVTDVTDFSPLRELPDLKLVNVGPAKLDAARRELGRAAVFAWGGPVVPWVDRQDGYYPTLHDLSGR